MIGYIFETTNKKTGVKYLGKRYAVIFDKNYFGEEANELLAKDIEKYGRPSFESRMLMPYEDVEVLNAAFEEMKPAKVEKKEESKVEPIEEKKPTKKGRKKVTEDK